MAEKEAAAKESKSENWGELADQNEEDNGNADPQEEKKIEKGTRWQEPPKEKKNLPPPVQRVKNERGDYVVTKIVVKDRQDELKQVPSCLFMRAQGQKLGKKEENKHAFLLEESEGEEEEEEEEQPEEKEQPKQAQQEKKQEKKKQMSKKEQKKKEMEELDSLLNEMGVKAGEGEGGKDEKKAGEEGKQETAEEKAKNEKNKKKKDKKKKKEQEAAAAAEEQKKDASQMTTEEKEAAIKEALKKRGGIQQQSKPKQVAAAALTEVHERKNKKNKDKVDYDL